MRTKQSDGDILTFILKDCKLTVLEKLFSNLSFLSFQLGNIRHIRKFSFSHHAGGGRGHNGELCDKRSNVITIVVEVRRDYSGMKSLGIPGQNFCCYE